MTPKPVPVELYVAIAKACAAQHIVRVGSKQEAHSLKTTLAKLCASLRRHTTVKQVKPSLEELREVTWRVVYAPTTGWAVVGGRRPERPGIAALRASLGQAVGATKATERRTK